MAIQIILLIFLLIHSSYQECKKYICQSITQPGGITKCQLYDTPSNIMSIQECPSSTDTCVYVDASNSNCVATSSIAATTYKKEFGQACSSNADCASATCTLNTCAVVAVGNACTNNYNCNKNHLCISNVCTVAVAENADCSTNINSCQYGSYCASTNAGTSYTCIKQYSIDAGADISLHSSVSGTADQKFIKLQSLCKSSYGNFRTSSIFNCWSQGETTLDYPKSCSTDADCIGTLGNKGVCECDLDKFHTNNGQGKCQGFISDYKNLLIKKSELAATNYASSCYPYQIEYIASGAQYSSSCAVIDNKCEYDDCYPNIHDSSQQCYERVGLILDQKQSQEYQVDNFFILMVIFYTVSFLCLMMTLHNSAIRPSIKGTGFFEE